MATTKNSSSTNREYTTLTEIRFRPLAHLRRLGKDCRHASFVVSLSSSFEDHPGEYTPTDQQIFDKLSELGRIEQHPESSRTNMPEWVALTGIEYDPMSSEMVYFAFSDAGEFPLRWPVSEGRMTPEELIDWLVNEAECEVIDLPVEVASR